MTPDLLREITGCTVDAAAKFAGPLTEACAAFDISTPVRLAAFLAQVGHESGSLRYVRELADGSAYEGRRDLGNTQPGDGMKYRGHGLIQITGRANHAKARDRLRARLGAWVPDFEAEPIALEVPQWAAMSAADFWDAHILNAYADTGDFESITRKINGGLNGQADRLARWDRAKRALAADQALAAPTPSPTGPEAPMPFPAIVAALLPSLIDAIPKLGQLFAKGETAQRNVKAAEVAFSVAKEALGATNEQEVVQRVQSDPAAAATVAKAVEEKWYLITQEAGGGGIEGAGKRDATARASGDMLKSPSFWVALALLPLVYMIVGSLIGLIGTATWSDDVRAGLAGSLISAIIGGLVGYYYGQTTSRNRTPPAP